MADKRLYECYRRISRGHGRWRSTSTIGTRGGDRWRAFRSPQRNTFPKDIEAGAGQDRIGFNVGSY